MHSASHTHRTVASGSRKGRAALAAMGVAALALTACGSVEDTASADLPDDLEGSLTVVCSPAEELCAAWADAFEAETGVQTNYVRLSAGEAAARLQAGGSTPEFDVWHGGTVDAFIAAMDDDLLAPYDSPQRAELETDVIDEDGYWSGIYVGALGFCSNQSRLDELGIDAPESWDDLLADELQGEVMMAHPSTSGTAYTALWTQVERLGSEEAAFDYMRDFNRNVLQYTRSGSAPAQSAGRGEVAVSLVFAHDCISHQEEGFEDLVLSFPAEGTGHETGAVAMINGTQNEEAAQAYIDWALSPAAQDLGPEVGAFQVLTHPDAVDDERMVSMDDIELIDYDFAEAGEHRSDLTQRFDEEIADEPAEDD